MSNATAIKNFNYNEPYGRGQDRQGPRWRPQRRPVALGKIRSLGLSPVFGRRGLEHLLNTGHDETKHQDYRDERT